MSLVAVWVSLFDGWLVSWVSDLVVGWMSESGGWLNMFGGWLGESVGLASR
jgi:hypothetical protein